MTFSHASSDSPGLGTAEVASGGRPAASGELDPRIVAWHDRLSPITEQYRALRTSLRSVGHLRHLLVTSALPGEGKSVTALNLAVALAECGDGRTLVVDADLRKPCLDRLAGLAAPGGLADVLEDRGRAKDFELETGVRNLRLLPAGRCSAHLPGRAPAARVAAMISELSGRYDLVVIDGPPVLVAAEATSLASMVDGTLFVVRLDVSPRTCVQEAVSQLTRGGARVLGTVVTGAGALPRAYQRYIGS